MRIFRHSIAYLAVLALFFTSCSKDEVAVSDSEKATISFGAILETLNNGRAAEKEHLDDFPDCSNDEAAYVEIVLMQGDEEVVGTSEEPYRVNLTPGQNFTVEDAALELDPGSYSLEHFMVYNTGGALIWAAPRTGSNMAEYVDVALPLDINLSAGVKKYIEVDVLCFDDRDVNEYGYLFFEINQNRAIQFCIFGNFCNEAGRHFTAAYSVNVWSYSNGELGAKLYTDLEQNVTVNSDGDFAASPLCIALPDREGEDEYYFEIRLLDADSYGNVDNNIIRAGIITDADVRDFMTGEGSVDYFHFKARNCGDIGDSPDLLNSENSELYAFIDDYVESFFNIEPFPAITPIFPDITIRDAYDFQERLNVEFQKRDIGSVTGYKLGFTGDERPFGAPKPLYGRIYSSFEVPNGSTLSLSEDFIRGSVGYEVAIVIGKDIRSAVSPEEAKDAVKAIAPAFEFADFGFTPNNEVIDFRDIIATNSAARTYILGEETLLEDLLNQGIDPNQINVTGTLEGEVILDARVGLPVDGVFKAVSFLSEELAARGEFIKAGDIILTGAIKGDQNAGFGTYVGDYGILGSIQFTLVE